MNIMLFVLYCGSQPFYLMCTCHHSVSGDDSSCSLFSFHCPVVRSDQWGLMKHIPASDFFPFVSAAMKLFPICKEPKIASQLSVPAGIRPHDSVRSACGMQRQALSLWLDAYHSAASSDWMLIMTLSCCELTEWPLRYQSQDAIAGGCGCSHGFHWHFYSHLWAPSPDLWAKQSGVRRLRGAVSRASWPIFG